MLGRVSPSDFVDDRTALHSRVPSAFFKDLDRVLGSTGVSTFL